MKNRFMLLALAILCYGHMQAGNLLTNYRNWPQIRKDIRNFSPYLSLPAQDPEVAARRAAAAGRLYEDTQVEKELSNAYRKPLKREIANTRSPLRQAEHEKEYYGPAREELLRRWIKEEDNKIWYHERFPFAGYFLPGSHPTYTAERHIQNRKNHERQLNEREKKYNQAAEKEQMCTRKIEDLKQKLNSFKTQLQQEQNQQRPSYEFFQHPSRNILGEY